MVRTIHIRDHQKRRPVRKIVLPSVRIGERDAMEWADEESDLDPSYVPEDTASSSSGASGGVDGDGLVHDGDTDSSDGGTIDSDDDMYDDDDEYDEYDEDEDDDEDEDEEEDEDEDEDEEEDDDAGSLDDFIVYTTDSDTDRTSESE